MTINKFQGKTESEAIEKAKKEMGPDVVIMSVKTIKPKGVFRAFKGIAYEVTAALEESESDKKNPYAQADAPQQARKPESINLTADEAIRLPVASQNRLDETAGLVLQQLQKQNGTETPEYAPQQAASGTGTPSAAFAAAASNTATSTSALEERLDSLQSLLEDRISAEKKNQEDGMGEANGQAQEGFSFVKMLYQTLLDNEVDEKYANQILDELEKITNKGSNIDYILSHIYQKLVLKFGQPKPIEFVNSRPTVAFFIGPTG
ncbi:MAG: flagellar biosynthesis protein FlhF, partial [Eubacterium sp.]|nr:flagellar biosynthesis protein FlhF [Eubacterium sp.]